jgi:type IV pilus assembly protein PilW
MAGRQNMRGFSLIELMVGMVIAILSSIVVYQVFAVSERQKRTTTGAADAQSNGAIGFYMMERDIKMAGWGLEGSAMTSCSNLYTYYEDATTSGPIDDFFASVSITDGGADPDSIEIKYYGNPADANVDFSLVTLTKTMPQSSAILDVSRTDACKTGNLAFAMQNGNCTLMEITQTSDQALKLQHNPGGSASYNPTIAYQSDHNWPAYTGCAEGSSCSSPASIQCFSKLFRRTYRIQDLNLELQEPDSANAMQTYQVVPEIIDLQAEYGIAPALSQQVNEWQPATGARVSPLATADNRRIKAVRIALVARSAQFEKPDSSGVCTTTTADMVDNWSSWATFDTANYPADWACYRYKVFETVVPLRNIIWSNL